MNLGRRRRVRAVCSGSRAFRELRGYVLWVSTNVDDNHWPNDFRIWHIISYTPKVKLCASAPRVLALYLLRPDRPRK